MGEAWAELTAGGHLLAVVAARHHDGVGKTLDDGALCLAEALLLPSASRVGKERNSLVEELDDQSGRADSQNQLIRKSQFRGAHERMRE